MNPRKIAGLTPAVLRRSYSSCFVVIVAYLLAHGNAAVAAPTQHDRSTFLLPMNCGELLPDSGPFISFLAAVGKGLVGSDKASSKRIFRLLALREKIAETASRDQNPVDSLIRKTLCFYREQKEPLRQIPYDEQGLVSFVRGALRELEQKVEEAVFQVEYDLAQRKQFELELEKNQNLVERIETEATGDAERTYKRLAESARRKVKQ